MPYASSIQVINDANGTAYAFLADNGNLFQGQWNAEAQRWDQGRILPGAYGAKDLQALVVDNLWPSSGSTGAVPGNAPGVVLVYRIGDGASTQVVASFGAWGPDGSLSWSEPVVVSSGQGENEAFSLGTGPNGTVQLVLQKREPSSSPQDLLAQFREAPQELIDQKLNALASGTRTDSDLYLSTLEIKAVSGGGYALQQSGNGNSPAPTPLSLESAPQATAPAAAPTGGNTQLSRAVLAANAAPTPASPTLLGSSNLLGATGELGAVAPASPGMSLATTGSTGSPGGGGVTIPGFSSRSGGSGKAALGTLMVPYRYALSRNISKANKYIPNQPSRHEEIDLPRTESLTEDQDSVDKSAEEISGISSGQVDSWEDIYGHSDFGRDSALSWKDNASLESSSGLGSSLVGADYGADPLATFRGQRDLVFKGLFGGLLAGRGGYTVANFSTIAGGTANQVNASFIDSLGLYNGYSSGLQRGRSIAGSLKTIYQYSGPSIRSDIKLLDFTAEETLGVDWSWYKATIEANGARKIWNFTESAYALLEQKYSSDDGLPEWLQTVGLTTGLAGDVFSKAATVTSIAYTYGITKGRQWAYLASDNQFQANGLGFSGGAESAATGIGLTSAILSAATVIGAASANFNQYGKASWGIGNQQAFRGRIVSKWGLGFELIAGAQENLLWNFSGIKPVPDVQLLAFASAGVALPMGGYIPLLSTSFKGNSKPSTTSSTQATAAATTTTPSSSGTFEVAPTGSAYPMSYAPAGASNALDVDAADPLGSLTSKPTPLYLYQLSGFTAATLSTGAIQWPNSGNGQLNDGTYTNVPLIGLALPGSATATASFTVSDGSIVPASFSVQLPQAQPGQPASGLYLALPQTSSGVYSFGVDVFQPVAGNPAPPTSAGASSVHAAMPLFSIDTGITSVLAVSAIARIPQQVPLKDFQQSGSYLAPNASGNSNDSTVTSYARVSVLLNGTASPQAPQQPITTLNPGTATVNLVNGQIFSVTLDEPLYFANPAQASTGSSLVLDLATALGDPSITNPSLPVIPQLQGLTDFTNQESFTANPTANNAGVYLSAGLIDTLPLLSSYGHWPVQNRVTYVNGAYTAYLNNTAGSSGSWSAVTPSELTLSQLSRNPGDYQFSTASEPTSITDLNSNTTYVFWVEASDPVVPLSGSDGEANYQAFMDALYGNQRINYSYTTTSQAGTNTKWNYINAADLYSSPGNIITNLRAFSVQIEVNGQLQDRALLVWTEMSISALQSAATDPSSLLDGPQATIHAGLINPNAASIPGGYQWSKLFNDSTGNSTIAEIPWTSDSGSGLSIDDISAAMQLVQVPNGSGDGSTSVLTPVLSWSQAVRTPYNEAVLDSQPALFLPLGSLQSGSNSINVGSASLNTETYASSTGLNTAIAGALPKSTASAVQNVQGLGVLATGLGSTNKPILDLLRNIPQADRNSAQNDPVAIFSGTIDGTTLTVSSLSQGTLAKGELLVGPGVLAGTKIIDIVRAFDAATGTAGVYLLDTLHGSVATSTLRAMPEPKPYSYSSFNGTFSGAAGSNGYTTLTVKGLSGSLLIGDRVFGLGLSGGSFVQQVQSFDAATGSGVYILNQGPQTNGGSYGLAALPGGSSSPYSIEFWTQLAPGSNPAGAGLVNLGQASAAALPDRPASAPEGWLLSSSFVVEQLTYQDALKLSLIPALPSGTSDSDTYGWRWALVADGANTTAMGGNGGANLNRNALVLDNLVVGNTIAGVNTFLANYGLSSSDLLGIDGTPADQIAAVPSTQFQFSTDLTSNAAVNQQVAETTLNGVAVDTSSAVMNGGIVTYDDASASLQSMFAALWAFEQKTGQSKVNFSLNPLTQTPATPSTPSATQLETYGGLELQFALLPGPAVSVNGSGQIAFDVAPGQTLLSTNGTDLRDNNWHYVVVSFLPDYTTFTADGSLVDVASNVGTASLYIDGKLVASVADVINPYAPSNVNDYAQLLSDNAQGSIDLVALYDKALTTSTVPPVASGWPLPTSQEALALLKEAGFVVASKTPNPGAIPGAVSNHWLAHTVDPNNALNSTYTSTLRPNGEGGGSWSLPSALNPLLAPQATTPSASSNPAQDDLLIAIQPGDWAKPGWFLNTNTSTTATSFNPASQDLKGITVTLTPPTTSGGSVVTRTLTPQQVLLGTQALNALAPQAQDQDFNYIFLSNTPALNLLISDKPQGSGDSNNLDAKLTYSAQITLSFENGSSVSNISSSTTATQGLALGFSNSLDSALKSTINSNTKALATAAVVEEAPLQLKYVDSGVVLSSQSTSSDSPASSFGMSQAAGYSANSNGTTQNGWLAIAQPRTTNAKSDPAGRVWINYTGQFTLNAKNQRTAITTDAANAPSTWLNALASSNFNPQAPNLPLLNSAIYQSGVGGLLIKADPSAGWGQNFGANMLVADVNNDGTQDLIISAPQANDGGAVVIIDGEWIANNLILSTGQTILDLSNPSNLGSYVTVLTPGTVDSSTDITTAAGFGSALAFDPSSRTLWIGTPNYLRTLDSSSTPNASTQPIGALYSYSTSAYTGSWGTASRTTLSNPILGTGGTLTTTQAGNTSSTSWWGSQFGAAVAVSSSGELAVSAPGVVGSMLYTGTEAANQVYLQGNRNFKPEIPAGVLAKMQLGTAIDATGGPTSALLTPISSLSANSLTPQQKTRLNELIDLAVTQVAPATTQNNQAFQSGAVGAVVVFQKGTPYSSLANRSITPGAIAQLNGTTFIGANPVNTQGDSGFGSSLTFADLINSNSQQLIVGASNSNGGGLVYTIDPSKPGADTSLGSNQFLAYLAATNVFSAAEAFDGLGNGLVNLGDVNKDGYQDVLLQAYNASSGAGNGYLLFGGDQLGTTAANQGLASLASGAIGSMSFVDGSTSTIAILSELGSAGSLTGQGNYGSGDVNADGYDDIQLGSGALASTYLTYGHAYLESISNLQLSRLTSDNGFMLDGLATSNQGSLRSLGDFNGDGYGDFISINPGNALTTVRIELGGNTQEILADAAYSYYSFTVANGTQVLPGGDINGDGMADIALFLDQNLSSSTDGNQGAGSTTGILYGRSSADLPLGSGFGFIAPVDPTSSEPLAPLPGLAVEKAAGEVGLTDATASVIAVGDSLYAAVKGKGDTTLWFTQSNDGGNSWNNWSELTSVNSGFATSTGPSLVYFNDTLYLSFVNSAGTLSLSSWDPTSSSQTAWSTPTALSGTTAAATAFSSSTAPQLVDRGDSLAVLWVQNGVVVAASTTEPATANTWTNPQELDVLQGGNISAIATSDAPSFTWLGTTPVLAVNEGGTIQVYAGQGGGATLQLATPSFLAPAGLSIVSAPVLTTTDTGLALTYTNSDGSISLQRLNLVNANGTPLPGVQFTSGGGVDVSQADLQWQNTLLTESNSGISSSLASTPVSVNGNLLLTNIRNSASQASQIWINAVPNASDPTSTTWLNSTVQLPDDSNGWSISQQASSSGPSWSTEVGGQSPKPPAFAQADGGVLYAAVQGTNNYLYWNSSSDGGSSWGSWKPLPSGMTTDEAPALAWVNDKLYLAYLGNGNSEINITSLTSETNNTWSTQYQIPNQGADSICMLNEGADLVIYYQGTNSQLYRTSTSNPGSSSGWQENSIYYNNSSSDNQTSSGQLAAAIVNGTTYLAYQGGTASSPSNTIYLTSSSNQSSGTSWNLISGFDQPINPTHSGVGLTNNGDGLMLSYADTVADSPVLVLRQGTISNNSWTPTGSVSVASPGGTTSSQASLFTPTNAGPNQVLLASINGKSSPVNAITTILASPSQLLTAAQTGSTLSPVGDLNNDGFADLLVTARNVVTSTSSGQQLATGLRVIRGAANSAAITNLNNSTSPSQTVQLAAPTPASSATPVTVITGSNQGPNMSSPTLNLSIGANSGSQVQAFAATVAPNALTSPVSSVAEASTLFSNSTASSQTLNSGNGWGQSSLNGSSSFGDLNGDGRLDFFDPAGNNAIATVQGLSFSLWSIRAAGDVNGNGVDDVLLSLAPQGPAYMEVTSGQPSALQSVLVDGSLFKVDSTTNSFRLDQLKAPLNPYNSSQLYDVGSTSTSDYAPSLQNWFEPILGFRPGSLTVASTANGFNPDTAESYTAPAVAISPEAESYLVFSGYDNKPSGSGLWIAYQQADGSWTQTNLPKGSDASFLSPSAVFYEGKLTIAYTDVNGDLNIAWCEGNPQDSGATWSSYQVVTGGTTDESSQWNPTLVVEAGRLALYFPSNAGNTQTQTIRYLYSNDPFNANANSNSNGNWGSSWSSKDNFYSGVSGTITIGTSQPTVTSPIAATTFQGRTVLAFRSSASNLDNGHILLLTQVASDPTASDPGTSLSWVQTDTGQTGSNGVGLTTDQALLYLTSTTFPSVNFSNPSPQIWSLAPRAGDDGTWNLGTRESVSGPGFAASFYAGYNPLSESSYGSGSGKYVIQLPTVLTPFMLNGKLMATWSGGYGSNVGNAFSVQLADLNATIASPSQQSLAGYSIDGNIDINGDGFKDVLISDPSNPGESVDNQYALFGGDFLNIASQVGTPGNDDLVGTPLADVIYSIGGSDVVISAGGKDVIYTGSGDDQISIVDSQFIRIDAGSGFDTLQLQGRVNQSYDFSLDVASPEYFAGTKLRDIELISSIDYGANALSFDVAAVNAINPDRILFLTPDPSDTIQLTGFTRNPDFDTSYAGSLWTAYTAGVATTPADSSPSLVYVLNSDQGAAPTPVTTPAAAANEASLQAPASLTADTEAPVANPVTLPSSVASSISFGTGLTLMANRSDLDSPVARFVIERSDSRGRQLVSYATSSANSNAKPGLHYTAVAGMLIFEPGESSQEITVPINREAMKLIRGGRLSLEVQELADRGQTQERHVLIQPAVDPLGRNPVMSGFKLEVDSANQEATISFRADANNEGDSLVFAISQRSKADANRDGSAKTVAILDAVMPASGSTPPTFDSDSIGLALDSDGRHNAQVQVHLKLDLMAEGNDPSLYLSGPDLDWISPASSANGNSLVFDQTVSISALRADQGDGTASFSLVSGGRSVSLLQNANGGAAGSITPETLHPHGDHDWRATEGRPVGAAAALHNLDLTGSSWTPTASLDGQQKTLQAVQVEGNRVTAVFEGGLTLRLFLETILSAPNAASVRPEVHIQRLAGNNNALGFYPVDSITGLVDGLNPSEDGYLQAALARAEASDLLLGAGDLPGYKQERSFRDLALDPNLQYGVLLLQNGRSDRMFSSFAAANPSGSPQMVSLGDDSTGMVLGIEDIDVNGGLSDRDYNDIILKISGLQVPMF